jgi:hypothetical protein
LLVTSSATPRSIARRCASSRLPTDDDVALADLVGQRADVHRQHPDAPGELEVVVAGDELAVELGDDRLHRRGGVGEARHLARLADVAARERPLGHDAGERAVVVDDRHQLEVLARHRQADLRIGLAVADGREAVLHHVATRGAGRARAGPARGRRCGRAPSASAR